jgi:hypothetical protein
MSLIWKSTSSYVFIVSEAIQLQYRPPYTNSEIGQHLPEQWPDLKEMSSNAMALSIPSAMIPSKTTLKLAWLDMGVWAFCHLSPWSPLSCHMMRSVVLLSSKKQRNG